MNVILSQVSTNRASLNQIATARSGGGMFRVPSFPKSPRSPRHGNLLIAGEYYSDEENLLDSESEDTDTESDDEDPSGEDAQEVV